MLCFKKFSNVLNTNYGTQVKGTGNPYLPEYGSSNTYNLFNITNDLITVNYIILWVQNTNNTKVKLVCENKILYPQNPTDISCFNYLDKDSKTVINHKKEANKKNASLAWGIDEISLLKIK